jgi:hypothetical protein
MGPQLRAIIQLPKNKEINRLIIDQIPTAEPTSPASLLGAPEFAIVVSPIAAPIPLKTQPALQ